MFLIAGFGKGTKIIRGDKLWQRFEEAKKTRNAITHPRKTHEITLTLQDADDAIQMSKEIISFVSQAVWKKEITW